MSTFNVPITLTEASGIARVGAVVRTGVPFPKGLVNDVAQLAVVDGNGTRLFADFHAKAVWPDGSIKWILLDLLSPIGANESAMVHVVSAAAAHPEGGSAPVLLATQSADEYLIDTGKAVFVLPKSGPALVRQIRVGEQLLLDAGGLRLVLRDASGSEHAAHIETAEIAQSGRLRCEVQVSGRFPAGNAAVPLRFTVTFEFHAGKGLLAVDATIWNPRAARHRGGLWDLGDQGSFFFSDCSLVCSTAEVMSSLSWYAQPSAQDQVQAAAPWTLYQDSSGGDQWQSPNHHDAVGRQTVRFRGFEVLSGDDRRRVAAGDRAEPGLQVASPRLWLSATCRSFWKEFPKALRWQDSRLEVGLFPGESGQRYEMQGGERKRHSVRMLVGGTAEPSALRECHDRVYAAVDPGWIAGCNALPWFAAPVLHDDDRYTGYIADIVSGPRSVFAKRETIDEYGWRNFGDLYADHEAVRHTGQEPFISHYNNQYDFVLGAGRQFARTGDSRWHELMEDAARHVMDIDIYHTSADKPAFNGGLFWHTDHYRPAVTSTHRTYSRANAAGGSYGGGPSNEHNYSSGLLLYARLTGDRAAESAVLGLADWVGAMDDGRQTILGLVDPSPTGAASATVEPDFHGPGRGAGNSINVLVDAYTLCGRRDYLRKAEEILQRCIHPRDDLESLHLDQPEHRWSYLVFLQVVGKYLGLKETLGEFDYGFFHARDSLLHYADWVLHHERPYKEILDRVEIPTETWPAHDIRKAHVLYIASRYVPEEARDPWLAKADEYHERCIADLLSFATSHLTRPQVLMAVYGQVKAYYRSPLWQAGVDRNCWRPHVHDFGNPIPFVPQRRRIRAALRHQWGLVLDEVSRRAGWTRTKA